MRPMLATAAAADPPRRRLGARGQVGRHAGARRRSRRGPDADLAAGQRRHGLLPRARRRLGERTTTCCSTARWSRWTAAARRSAPWPSACTSGTGVRPSGSPRLRPVTLMVFDLLRLYGTDLTSQPAVGPSRPARAARPRRSALAGATGLRRRRRAVRRDPRAGTRGRGEQAALRAIPARAAVHGLAEVAPQADRLGRRRWLAAERSAPPTGSGPCCSACPRRRGGGMRGRIGSGIAGQGRSASSPSCSRR